MAVTKKRKLYQIALLVETTRSYGRNILRGIADYARIHGPWLFYLPPEGMHGLPDKSEWSGDGIIVQPHQDQSFIAALQKSKLPFVSLSGPPNNGSFPTVLADQESLVQTALNHLRERGFTEFAYCGYPGEVVWPPTGRLFVEHVEKSGHKCHVYQAGYSASERTLRLADLAKWLHSLPKPIGLLAGSDSRAREVLDACRLDDLHVPDEIAVLGVNDDELICELANPPLSSVVQNTRRIGFEAAALLDHMLSGTREKRDIVVPPLGVKARQSTDLLAIEDKEIAKAVRYIRENACNGIRVQDVLDNVALSRRAFEMRFRDAIGRPPHEEIRRVQIERVKELLLNSDYKLERIAEMTGFSTAQYLAGLFHRVSGMTPGSWRRSARAGGKT